MKENRKLLREVLQDIRRDMTDEEVLNLLADSKISEGPDSEKSKYTLGQRAADSIAKFAGSWAFIFSFTGVLILWMAVNTVLAARAFDPYPFILLNLVLSCVAAIQAPLIMMSQNRQEEKDRRRAENDYKVNLKTEIMIETCTTRSTPSWPSSPPWKSCCGSRRKWKNNNDAESSRPRAAAFLHTLYKYIYIRFYLARSASMSFFRASTPRRTAELVSSVIF